MIFVENPLAGKGGKKNLAKSEFGKFAPMKKHTQLLFIEHISEVKKI
jgi:hypothetical protein